MARSGAAAAVRRRVVVDLASWLRAVRGWGAEPLITPGAWQRLDRAARCLPGDVLAALELRLARAAPRVDLSVRLATPAQARAAAALAFPEPLRELLSRWARSPEVRGQIPAIWLELDLEPGLEPGAEGLPAPVVCWQLAETLPAPALADDLLPALLGQPLGERQRQVLQQCFCRRSEETGLEGRLLYAFDLQARGGRALRLEILGRDACESLRDFERVTGLAAPAELVHAAALMQTVERPHLSLDVADDVLPRLGLEGSFRRLPHREPRWAGLLDLLVGEGLCTAEKRDALLAWPGYKTAHGAGERWPRAAPPRGWCVRSLSHLKLVVEPGRPLEAKAYLTVQHLARARPSAALRGR